MPLAGQRSLLFPPLPSTDGLKAHMKGLSGIVRLWMLQEAAGAATAVDETGGSNGTLNGCAAGLVGAPQLSRHKAYSFDGINDTIEIAADATRNRSAITCVALVNPVAGATTQTIFYEETNGGAGTAPRFRLVMTGAELLSVGLSPTSAEILVTLASPFPLTIGSWQLVAGEIDVANDTLRLWRSGSIWAQATNGGWTATATEDLEGADGPVIGASTNTAAARQLFWFGQIGMVAVFSRLLSASEHAAIAKKAGIRG